MLSKTNLLLVAFFHVLTSAEEAANPEPEGDSHISDHRFFLHEIFTKYGNGGQMTFEGFEHLLESLGLGNIMIRDHDVLSHKVRDEFRDTHNTHEHSKSSNEASSGKRGIRAFDLPKEVPKHNDTRRISGLTIHGHSSEDHDHNLEDHNHNLEDYDHNLEDHDHNSGDYDHNSGDHDHNSDNHNHNSEDQESMISGHNSVDHDHNLGHHDSTIPSHNSENHDHNSENGDHGTKTRDQNRIPSNLRTTAKPYKGKPHPPLRYTEPSDRDRHHYGHVHRWPENNTGIEHKQHKLPCLSPEEILILFDIKPEQTFNYFNFLEMCPVIVYELDQRHCRSSEHGHGSVQEGSTVTTSQWLYASLAVLLISLCGLFSVAVIPIMQKWFYHTLLQFLVGLAVGSLSGDALLHLMPHAMLGGEESHSHELLADEGMREEAAVWRGMMALGGIYFFFIAERLLNALTTYRRKKNAALNHAPRVMIPVYGNESVVGSSEAVGEKLSQYRKNSYGGEIGTEGKESSQMLPDPDHPPSYNESARKDSRRSSGHEIAFHGRSSFSADPEPGVTYHQAGPGPNGTLDDPNFVVTVAEHHGHGHGHSHEVPQSVSAVAWMVIMGDGLHNFCDGLAIGAAFASGLAGGISTTVAVFCHELPHELGDFAMLLKTGMKVKQALMYNGLSSVLCFIGMVIGLALGNVHSATAWVFAGTAGMFLYIALVDMLPELETSTSDPGSTATYTLAIQVLGISIGVSVMLLIAIYEHDLKNMVS